MTTWPARVIIRLSAVVVPAAFRARWREEWLAEIDAAPRGWSTLVRACGGPLDALTCRWATDGGQIDRPRWQGGWRSDVRDAWRSIRRTPVQTLTIVICLSIGSTLTVLMFGVVNAILGGDLPGVRARARLVSLAIERGHSGDSSGLTMGQFRALPSAVSGLDSLGAEEPWHFSMSAQGQATSTSGAFVSGAYFSTLGTTAAIGRLLEPADDRAGAPPVVVVGYGCWRRFFDGRPDVLGSTILVGTGAYRIVGVTPEGFTGLGLGRDGQATDERGDIWMPMSQMWMYPDYAAARVDNAVGPHVIARIGAEFTPTEAEAQSQVLVSTLAATGSRGYNATAIRLVPFRLLPLGVGPAQIAALVLLLMSVPALVLGIACANVAGVQLARAIGRTHELAVRVSLGATRWRVTRLLIVETSLLAMVAGSVAWIVASRGLQLSARLLPFSAQADTHVFIVSVVVPLVVTILSGLLPAWRATGFDVLSGLRLGPRVGRIASPRTRRAVVAAQVALSVLLLLTSGALIRALESLPTVIGPAQSDVFVAALRFSDLGFSADRQRQAQSTLLERVAGLPGVTSVAASTSSLFDPSDASCWGDASKPVISPWDISLAKLVTPEFFGVIRLLPTQGRVFRSGELHGVVVVNAAFLATLPAGQAAIGSTIRIARSRAPSELAQIIGVVENSYERYPIGIARPQCYLAMDPSGPPDSFAIYARSTGAALLGPEVQRLARDIDTRLSAHEVGTIADIMRERFRSLLWLTEGLSDVSVVALLLAAVGLFGVMSYAVSQRTHEFGVRLALGARPRDLVVGVVRDAWGVTTTGLSVGLMLSVPMTLFLKSRIASVSLRDPAPAILVVITLMVVSLVAVLLPARRASAIDPVRALKAD